MSTRTACGKAFLAIVTLIGSQLESHFKNLFSLLCSTVDTSCDICTSSILNGRNYYNVHTRSFCFGFQHHLTVAEEAGRS